MISATFGWNVLYISIKSIWSNVVFKVSVYLNCFLMPVDFLDDLRHQFLNVKKTLEIHVFGNANVEYVYSLLFSHSVTQKLLKLMYVISV